jgi:hypothetical protein
MAEHAAMSEHGNRKRLFVPGRPFHLRRFYIVLECLLVLLLPGASRWQVGSRKFVANNGSS